MSNNSESQNVKPSFLESAIYKNPSSVLDDVFSRLGVDEDFVKYFNSLTQSDSPKDDEFQSEMKVILDKLLAEGKNEEAGLIFNIHRTLTNFRGYGSNENVSSDVEACFGDGVEIPDDGLIVVDFFVARNLPKIVEICEKRGIDLSRIRACVPKGVLAARLMGMSDEKKEEFEGACSKLNEDQFLIDDVNHNSDISLGDEKIAVWFSPRTMAIAPALHAETEDKTIDAYRDWFKSRLNNVVNGGRVFANLAFSDEFKKMQSEMGGKNANLAKLTGISKNVASSVVNLMIGEGFEFIGDAKDFNPSDINPEVDHPKMAKSLHFRKGVVESSENVNNAEVSDEGVTEKPWVYTPPKSSNLEEGDVPKSFFSKIWSDLKKWWNK